MSGFLLDTPVLSAFAPDRPPVPSSLQHWIVDQGARNALFTSSVVILEIQRGIAKLRRSGGAARADRLDGWFSTLLSEFAEQILHIDANIALVAGKLDDSAIARGRSPGLADVLIAATALSRDLTVLTSNLRHFEVLGVKHIDPLISDLPKR